MKIRIGFDIAFECAQRTPMILMLRVRPERAGDLDAPDTLVTSPSLPTTEYVDDFGNICTRVVLPPGQTRLTTDTVINDSGEPDPVVPDAPQLDVADLPHGSLVYLLGSRYVETDKLSQAAWNMFGTTPPGWARVQAIVDHVHNEVEFGYANARSTKSASDVRVERAGVCRDFAHLAIAYCRCMNIPARYVTGYLGDIGVPKDPAPMDFSAWFEAYLGGKWYAFDARHNKPRIGRIVMARGRDASDVAISTSFGAATLVNFKVWTDEVEE